MFCSNNVDAGCWLQLWKNNCQASTLSHGLPPWTSSLAEIFKPTKTHENLPWTNNGLDQHWFTLQQSYGKMAYFQIIWLQKKGIVHSCYQRVPCTNNGFSTKSNLVPKTIDACVSDVALIHFGWLLNPHVWCWGQSLLAQFHENSVSYRSSTVYTKNDILLLLGKKYYFNFNWTNDQFPVLPAKFDETISISLRSVQHLAAFFLLSCFSKKTTQSISTKALVFHASDRLQVANTARWSRMSATWLHPILATWGCTTCYTWL